MSDSNGKASDVGENVRSSADGAGNGVDPKKEKPILAEVEKVNSDFVNIIDHSGEVLELPTSQDNALFMSTLQSSFPGATGLKYKNPKTGASRAVQVDPTGTKLLAPADGWDDKVFSVIVTRADVSAKRRKLGASDDESDSDGEAGGRSGRKRAVQSTPPAEARRPVDLIVLGINYKTTDDAFKQYFATFGTVIFAEVKRAVDGSSKGFGFVRMSTIEEQDRVVAAPQHVLDARRCDVRIPETRFDAARPRAQSTKLFVGRLNEKVTENSLMTFFSAEAKAVNESCTVTDVFVPKPFRGFAFITFSLADAAEKLAKQGTLVMDDTSVVVSLAVPREETAKDPHQQPSQQQRGGGNRYDYGYVYGKRYFDQQFNEFSRDQGNFRPNSPGFRGGYNSHFEKWSSSSGYPSNKQPMPRGNKWPSPPQATRPGQGPVSQRPQPLMSIRNNSPPLLGTLGHAPPPPPPGHSMPSPFSNPPPNYGVANGGGGGYPTTVYPGANPDTAQSLLYGQAANIASGLDALDLNPKPELLSAAWTAFLTTLSNSNQHPRNPPPANWK